ncbi:MAG: bifunctional UDP-3-O-[3-hydroxymyristoyl] N-acetylglucosamine deacetylase/3-hydroxyacyl-ACP dehydratase [Candidatus Firestonebacteria bacterium]|nr:bifunctional UDP-3-O-[3-hydroxymyristoyl] N-acetylglucosamine deacetylase/3-hydroxyacyl-ACP dehydratase [Candidatus Firestonebacteria bacterium]
MNQRTLAQEVRVAGVGLHTGIATTLTFKPALPDTGYVIVRTDLPGAPCVHPRAQAVSQTRRGTTLCENGVEVHTVEHVLAALAGMQVDNCRIELSGSEPPIMDGSAKPFVEALLSAGIVEQPDTVRRVYRLPEIVTWQDGDKTIVGWPHRGLRVTFVLRFENTWVPEQRVTVDVTPETFEDLVSRARTFCFENEFAYLESHGLAKGGIANGGTSDNALVLGSAGVKNGPLRFEGELAYHKILDFIGDLALVGLPVEGHFVAYKSGHALNTGFARRLQQASERAQYTSRGKGTAMIIQAKEIQDLLPHRYPFLLVDRVIDLEEGKRAVGIKNVTINEPFFQGHFPGHPIMPGVLIVEAMAQVGGVLLLKAVPDAKSKVVYFVSLDNVKFRKPVLPGDQLRFVLEVVKLKERIAKMHGQAYVGEDLVCEADLMSTLMDK